MNHSSVTLPCPEFPAAPIWLSEGGRNDEYADFFPLLRPVPGHRYTLKIAADSDYNIWLNDTLLGFGQYSDWVGRLVYDEYDFVPDAAYVLKITAWHSGVDSQTHIRHLPYLAFAVWEDGVCICASGPETPSRPCPRYVQHCEKQITVQMGPGFSCICSGTAGDAPLSSSRVTDVRFDAVCPRPNRKLVLGDPIDCTPVRSGRFTAAAGKDAAARMQKAVPGAEDAHETADGTYVLWDAGVETVGFPELRFLADTDGCADFGWGEHLTDGMCRTAIGDRRFTAEFHFSAGENRFFPALRRIGGRYFQIFIPGNPQNIRLRFYPVEYPVEVLPGSLTGLRKTIRDTAIRTLRACMHEHYEDCPWREQALYTLDSRNQMLAGYRVFAGGNTEMVRASLDLISRSVRPDGLLTLCAPAGRDFPIPVYSLAYFIQFREYLDFSEDIGFAKEKLPMLRTLMRTVLSRKLPTGEYAGLCPRYPDSRGLWNFYEWSESMDGFGFSGEESQPPCEAPFNAFLVLALEAYAVICRKAGAFSEALTAQSDAADVRAAIRRVFRREDGCFRSFTDRSDAPLTVLTQALCLLCGAADGLNRSLPLSRIAENGGSGTVPATLSMACWRYDALLRENREKYAPVVLEEIDRDCSYMLSRGATTFWETIKGEADFGGAGSLCHGWSAMAAYYYAELIP